MIASGQNRRGLANKASAHMMPSQPVLFKFFITSAKHRTLPFVMMGTVAVRARDVIHWRLAGPALRCFVLPRLLQMQMGGGEKHEYNCSILSALHYSPSMYRNHVDATLFQQLTQLSRLFQARKKPYLGCDRYTNVLFQNAHHVCNERPVMLVREVGSEML